MDLNKLLNLSRTSSLFFFLLLKIDNFNLSARLKSWLLFGRGYRIGINKYA